MQIYVREREIEQYGKISLIKNKGAGRLNPKNTLLFTTNNSHPDAEVVLLRRGVFFGAPLGFWAGAAVDVEGNFALLNNYKNLGVG